MSLKAVCHVAASVFVLAVPSGAHAQLETPAHWRWVTDRPAPLVTGQVLPDTGWRFVAMPPGWHVTMGPGGVLYDPAYTAAGRYALEAEIFLFPEKSDQGFGIFVGGRALDAEGRAYLAFMIRHDGQAAIVRHAGDAITPLVSWTPGDSVVKQDSSGTARNVLRVAVERDSVFFDVNGGRVASVPRTAEFDGHFGFRVGAGLNLHISTLDFMQRIAPPRR